MLKGCPPPPANPPALLRSSLPTIASRPTGAKLGRLALDRGMIKKEYIAKTEKFYEK